MLGFFTLFVIISALASVALTIWSIYDIATQEFRDKDNRVIWMIVVFCAGLFGSLLYLLLRNKLLVDKMALDDREYLPPLDDYERKPIRRRYDDDDLYV